MISGVSASLPLWCSTAPGEQFDATFGADEDTVILRERSAAAEPGNAKESEAVIWLLDAGVLSQPSKTRGNRAVIDWLE
jgi:hypothetical protein